MSLARFAAAAIACDVVHDVMDHVVQTDAQARDKADVRDSRYWAGAMIGHAGGQALAQGAALAVIESLTGRRSWGRVLAAAAVVGTTHAFLDRRWPVVNLLRATGSENFAYPVVRRRALDHIAPNGAEGAPLPIHGPYLADQALHRLVTLTVAAAMS